MGIRLSGDQRDAAWGRGAAAAGVSRGKALAALAEWLVCCLACLAMDSVCYALFGEWQMDHIVFGVFLALYAVVRSRYDFRVCLVRGWMFMASTMVMLPISEPLGRMFAAINQAYYAWAQYLTPVVVAAMIFAEVWFLRHDSFDIGNASAGNRCGCSL